MFQVVVHYLCTTSGFVWTLVCYLGLVGHSKYNFFAKSANLSASKTRRRRDGGILQGGLNAILSVWTIVLFFGVSWNLWIQPSPADTLAHADIGGVDVWREWCPLPNARPLSKVMHSWYVAHLLYRYATLLETVLLAVERKHISGFHVIHHVGVVCSGFLWVHQQMHLGGFLIILNMIDNLLYYGAFFLEDWGVQVPRQKLLAYWTEIETALGYAAVGIYFALHFFFSPDGCGEFSFLLITIVIHAGVGFFLNRFRRAKQEKPYVVWKLWLSIWVPFGLAFAISAFFDAQHMVPLMFIGCLGGIANAIVQG